MTDILLEVEKPALKTNLPDFAPGDAIRVHVKVREGEKERIQVFAGVVIARRGGGCLAGPVVAAAVILPEDCVLPGLDDSKKIDAACRERLDAHVRGCAIAVGVGVVDAREIDNRDILRASLAAMRIAVEALRP